MTIINQDRWRDQQLSGFSNTGDSGSILLAQEKIMLDWVQQYPDVKWKWVAPETKFKKICQGLMQIADDDCNGLIMFNLNLQYVETSKNLVDKIRNAIETVDYAYVGINRYQLAINNLDLELPDSIADSLDVIMQYCDPRFKRLHTFDQVDGNHMVYAHPMDCYVLCK